MLKHEGKLPMFVVLFSLLLFLLSSVHAAAPPITKPGIEFSVQWGQETKKVDSPLFNIETLKNANEENKHVGFFYYLHHFAIDAAGVTFHNSAAKTVQLDKGKHISNNQRFNSGPSSSTTTTVSEIQEVPKSPPSTATISLPPTSSNRKDFATRFRFFFFKKMTEFGQTPSLPFIHDPRSFEDDQNLIILATTPLVWQLYWRSMVTEFQKHSQTIMTNMLEESIWTSAGFKKQFVPVDHVNWVPDDSDTIYHQQDE